MSETMLAKAEPVKESEIRFSVTVETIKPMAEKYLALKIKGLNDVAGREAVKEAAKACQKARTTVDNEREAAKKEYLEAGRRIQEAAKTMWEMIAPVEEHLKAELKRIADEEKRINDEQVEVRFQKRAMLFASVGGFVPGRIEKELVRVATEERIEELLDEAKEYHERIAAEEKAKREEAERIEAEQKAIEERNRIESDNLAAERAEFERLKVEEAERQRAAQAKIDEANRIENERLSAIQKKIDDDKRAAEVAAEIERKAKEKAEQIEKQRIANERIAAEMKAKEEALKPDREKIMALASRLESIQLSALESLGLRKSVEDEIGTDITDAIAECVGVIRQIAKQLQ